MKYFNRVIIVFCVIYSTIIYIPGAAANAAIDALNANRLDEARALFLQQLTKTEMKNDTLTHLGKLEFHAGNYDKAIDYLLQAIAAAPDAAINYLLLGRSYGRKTQTVSMFSAFGLAKKCVESFEKAYSLNAKNTEILQELVNYHTAAPAIVGGSPEKLSQYLAELKAISPEMAAVYEINSLEKAKKHDKAIALALDLKQREGLLITTRYSLAHYFKENKFYAEAEEVLDHLVKTPLTTQATIDDRWYVNDASLQLGEVFLATNKQLDRAVILVENFQKNSNPNHVHYFWAFLSLAKIHKANGDLDKYKSGVRYIKTLDYKKDKYFSKEFEEELKNYM